MITTPCYTTPTTVEIGMLQLLQVMLKDNATLTLAEVLVRVKDLQMEHGQYARLEDVIQAQVGSDLRKQREVRRQRCHGGV